MGILIDSDDFTGVFALSQGTYTSSDIDAYIDLWEKTFLVELLGVELFDLFEADLVNQVPQDPIYLKIYNSFYIDNEYCVVVSDGMKKMLLGMIYFLYVRDAAVNTKMGSVINVAENSREAKGEERGLTQRYNKAISTYDAIQWCICDNDTDDYPTYNGQHKEFTSGI